MTRIEIEAKYEIVNGRIKTPGKFEGELVYVPHFYQLALDGAADYQGEHPDGSTCDYFNLNDDDREEWPELRGFKTLRLDYTNDGFVIGNTI